MADSFADLWNSTGVSKPSAKPPTLSSQSSLQTGSNASRPRLDTFSILAATPSSSQPTSRSITPSHAVSPNGAKAPPKASLDAFSSLLGSSFGGVKGKETGLSLADRQMQQSKASVPQQQQVVDAVWDGLDMLGGSSLSPSRQSEASHSLDDGWVFGGSETITASKVQVPGKASAQDSGHLDSFDLLSDPPSNHHVDNASHKPVKTDSSSSFALFDVLDAEHTEQPIPTSNGNDVGDPGNFDFGNREDLDTGHDSDDGGAESGDFLGIFGATSASRQMLSSPRASPIPRSSSSSRTATASPPPHVVGQIVEMGFSPQQARVALAATDSGLDVQQALEMLLSNGASGPEERREGDVGDDEDRHSTSRTRRGAPRSSLTDGASVRSATNPRTSDSSRRQQTGSPSTSSSNPELQERADKLLAQASELGLNMFSRANAFWKESKAKAQKVYEEQIAASNSGSNTPSTNEASAVANGRPKWMADAGPAFGHEDADGDAIHPKGKEGLGFRDEDDVPRAGGSTLRAKQKPPRPLPRERETNLLGVDEPAVYVSPARRRPASSTTPSIPPRPPPSSSNASRPVAPSPPLPLTERQTVSATPSAISASTSHKTKGTEMYKLGRFVEAESSYSSALSALPENHLLRIPLYNNRAATRLKTGDHSGATEDCSTVISVIGPSYHPAKEVKITKAEDGAGVDLADALVKAYKRRAESFEGREKWDLARSDWESIIGCEWVTGNAKRDALSGIGRCKGLLKAEREPAIEKPTTRSSAPSRAKVTPRLAPLQTFEAVEKLRSANAAADAEEARRAELKDVVDARLLAWKGGKETNLRALIASLENVLWSELQWKKVGMHELVTPAQVKIRYVKAIAKVHPDKLSASSTTLEHRMIANGVFASLNEAWVAFQS